MIVTLVRGVARNVSFGLAMTTHLTMMPPTRSWDVRQALLELLMMVVQIGTFVLLHTLAFTTTNTASETSSSTMWIRAFCWPSP